MLHARSLYHLVGFQHWRAGAVAMGLLLNSCQHAAPPVAVLDYPQLPDLAPPSAAPHASVTWDVPRDAKGNPVAVCTATQLTGCVANIYLGLTSGDWATLTENMLTLQQREREWQALLSSENSMRQHWRDMAAPPAKAH